MEQALRVMTINGAWSMGIDDKAGSIEVGKSADLIVLDRNLFDLEPQGNMHNTQVDVTLIEGQLVWDRLEQFKACGLTAVWHKDEVPEFYDKM
ncbi:amidohydrolase family protein [Colwellia maritima]|uniref:amidohydrolase family protein n=1 Tax=Colwellia maritima TaxID=2912588 RepID=UPI003084361F